MSRVPGFEGVDRPRRPDGRGRARAGRRSPPVPRARGLRPDLFPGSDRRSRPGLPLLDGRLSGLLRAGIGRFSQGLGHVRASAGQRSLRRVLASRNTLIFMWKNTSGARLMQHFLWLPIRLAQPFFWGGRVSCAGFLGALHAHPSSPGGPARDGRGAGGMGREAGGILPAFSVVEKRVVRKLRSTQGRVLGDMQGGD